MEIYSIKNQFEDRLEALFIDPKYQDIEIVKNGFYSNDKIERNALIFLGLNPSLRIGEKARMNIFYQITQMGHADNYFKKFEALAGDGSERITWNHLDTLFCQETKQEIIQDLARTEISCSFIWEQLQFTKEILEAIQPKILVVTNSYARTLLGYKGGWLGYKFEFDHSLGTHRIMNPNSNLYRTPVFFTSMLSGQRAMDLGSYERLKWHIDFVNKQLV